MFEKSLPEESIFAQALEIHSASERAAFLERSCGDNQSLRDAVEALLRAHERSGDLLDLPEKLTATVDDPSVSERPGTVIGPYKLLEQIGEGGFGVVFMAEQTQPVRRKVALKVLKPGMDTRQVVARFEAERQALAIMDHPNIAHVFDGGETVTGRPFFVMELVRGIPITEFCDQNRLSIRERLELFVDVCRAVQHAHQKGIIHRDLKPSNVMVTLHDGTPVVKVIDFGIAKATGQQLTDKTLFTHFAQMIGTPLYMSPEQAGMSSLDVDTRSDIYSLGVLLYELLTATTPFDKERLKEMGYDEMLRIIREQEPAWPSTRISTLGKAAITVSTQRQSEPKQLSRLFRGELDWIVMKALEKDRNRRYETANAFASDIQRYLHDEPVLACPPTFVYQLRKFARRNKGRLAVVALVLIFLASLGGVAVWAALQQAAQRAALEADLGQDLDAARDFCRQDRLREASAVLDHAQTLADRGGADDWSVCRLNLTSRVAQVRRDVNMAAHLEAICLEGAVVKDEHFDREGAALRYTEAFRDYGVDVDKLDPEESAARIKRSEIRKQLIAALDVWLISTPRRNRKRLLDVLVRADANPWCQQLRAAFVEENLKALRALASKANASGQPPSAAALLGTALRDLGEVGLAMEFLRRAQQAHPSDFWLNLYLGSYMSSKLGSARAGEAVGYLRVALALRPDSAGVLVRLGYALYKQGNLPGALAAYQKAIALKPDYAEAHYNLGDTLLEQGDLPGAVAAYQKANALKPDYAEVQLDVVQGRYYVRLSQWDKAAAEYAKADWSQPLRDDAFAYACLFLIRGDSEGYNRFCQRMIQRAAETKDPGEVYVLARSCAMARKGPVDPARAVQWANQAVANYKKPWNYHVLGLAQYRAGQFDPALQNFTKAKVPAWRFQELNWFGLALVHHRLDHPDEARRCLDKGIQWLQREGPPSPGQPAKFLPQDWIEAQLLRREAEELLKTKRSP